MTRMFLDIETLPAEEAKHEILKEIFKKRQEDGKKVPDTFEEYLEATNLDGSFGRIACISYALNEEPVKTLSGDEKEMLTKFWEIAHKVDQFVGFNLMDFDLRFICQRSVILGVRPSRDLNFARYRNYPIFDLMYEWSKWNTQNKVSLDHLAHALGIPSSKNGAVEGKNVAAAYIAGRIAEICEYCEKDVEVTRQIYKRMVFSDFQGTQLEDF